MVLKSECRLIGADKRITTLKSEDCSKIGRRDLQIYSDDPYLKEQRMEELAS